MMRSALGSLPSIVNLLEEEIKKQLEEDGDDFHEYASVLGLEPREAVIAALVAWLLEVVNHTAPQPQFTHIH